MISLEEFEEGLKNKDPRIRSNFAAGFVKDCPAYPLTPEQIERGLNDPESNVRTSFLNRLDYKITPEQLEKCLTHSEVHTRVLAASRPEILPTKVQIERGLASDFEKVRAVFESRESEWESKYQALILKERFESSVERKNRVL